MSIDLPRWFPVLLVLLLLGSSAQAQMPGGERRGRGMGNPDMPKREAGPRPAALAAPPSDLLTAFERELPSLRMDLKLEPSQAGQWDQLARALRQAAEAQRSLGRLALSARTTEDEKPLDQWLDLLEGLARERSAALAEARAALALLEPALSPEQRRLLSRRFRQAQTEPLGP